MSNGQVITNTAIGQILNAHFKSVNTPPTKMQIGNSTTTPTASDTALGNKIPVDNYEIVDDCDATTGWSGGTDSVVALNTSTYKEATGSLSLSKTGTAGTVMSMSKTTTSLDFTSKDFWAWIYITALSDLVSTGTALTIRFGSDSSNYYYYDVAIGSLAAGWNYIKFSTATASGTTGSPSIAACDYTYFAFNTDLAADTIAADRILIDDIKLSSSTDYDISLVATYPTVDTTTLQAQVETMLSTTQANGASITEIGTLDASSNLQSHAVFNAESKSNTDIFYFVETIRIRNQS